MTATALPRESAASASVHALSIALIDEAVARCRSEDVDRCHDWEDVVALIDWSAQRRFGKDLRAEIRSLLEQAGLDLLAEAGWPHPLIERMVLEAAEVACNRLAEIRAAAPIEFDEAVRRAMALLKDERASALHCPVFAQLLRAGAAHEAAAVEALAAGFDEMSVPRLVQLGIVVTREGFPALPGSNIERSAALAKLRGALREEVLERLTAYRHPTRGHIRLRDVTLTPDEEAAVRAAATELFQEAA